MELTIDFVHLNLIVGTLLPVLIGIVTKTHASRVVKTWVNAVLSAIAGALVPILNSCAEVCTFELAPLVLGIGVTWITSIATYYGFWSPSGADDKIHSATSAVGVG